MTVALYFTNFKTLDDPAAGADGRTNPLGVNDQGEIVGDYTDASGEHGFVYNNGAFHTLDDPNGSYTFLSEINNSGEIVGNSSDEAFSYEGGVFTNIQYTFTTSGGVSTTYPTIVSGLNNKGVVVGTAYPPDDTGYIDEDIGLIDSAGVFTTFQHDGLAIDDNGLVLGYIVPRPDIFSEYFLYKNSKYDYLQFPVSLPEYGDFEYTGLNDSDELVGSYLFQDGPSKGFVQLDGAVFPVTDPDGDSNGFGTFVTGINNAGQIVGYYYDANNTMHGFVADVNVGSAPAISGASAHQAIVDKQTDTPFAGVAVADANAAALTETVTVTLSDPANGTLSDLSGGAYDAVAGEYTVSGSAAAVSAALDALVFTPTVAPGATATTTFTIEVDDGLVAPVMDSTTSVTATSTLGAGQNVALTGAPGFAASLYDTGDSDWDIVHGQSGTVFLTNADASIVGGDMKIVFDGSRDSVASLYRSANAWDIATGAGGSIILNDAQAAVFGGASDVYFNTGSSNAVSFYDHYDQPDSVFGSFGNIALINSQAFVYGDDDAVYFAAHTTDAALISTSIEKWDTVVGSSGAVTLVDAQAAVVGAANQIYFGDGDGDYHDDVVSLYQTMGQWDNVWYSGGTVILNSAQASVFGGHEAIVFEGASGNQTSLHQTNNAWDAVYGSGGSVVLNGAQTSILGGGDTVYFDGDAENAVNVYRTDGIADSVIGSNGVVALNDAQASVAGDDDTVYLNGVSNLLALKPGFGTATVYGFGFDDVLQFSKSDFADFAALHPMQSGADTVIRFDAADAVTLTNVVATKLDAAQFAFV